MKLKYQHLKALLHQKRELFSDATQLRIHRGLSWLHAAETTPDLDTQFILLWVAFNSIYAKERDEQNITGERKLLEQFLGRLIRLDQKDQIYSIVWENYSDKIRLFIDNCYVTRWFWDFQNGKISESNWKRKFSQSQKDAQKTLVNKDTPIFCSILFDRLYVLRNQLMHGGATWNSTVNRDQVKDGARILESFIPVMIQIMLENPQEEWGSPCFPPVDKN